MDIATNSRYRIERDGGNVDVFACIKQCTTRHAANHRKSQNTFYSTLLYRNTHYCVENKHYSVQNASFCIEIRPCCYLQRTHHFASSSVRRTCLETPIGYAWSTRTAEKQNQRNEGRGTFLETLPELDVLKSVISSLQKLMCSSQRIFSESSIIPMVGRYKIELSI